MTLPAEAVWEAFASKVVLRVTGHGALDRARAAAAGELEAIDRACSRFRSDSELVRANARSGQSVRVSPLLAEALVLALRGAEITGGDVDPTVGAALVLAGYDRDWRLLDAPRALDQPSATAPSPTSVPHIAPTAPSNPPNTAPTPPTAPPDPRQAPPSTPAIPTSPIDTTPTTPSNPTGTAPGTAPKTVGGPLDAPVAPRATATVDVMRGWRRVTLDRERCLLRMPAGATLDLGATAKAWAADRAARAAARAGACGALVAIGGDVAVHGPAPEGGWLIRVTDDHRSDPSAPGQTVSIISGGLATSSTTVRRWSHGGRTRHHVLDPATGEPAVEVWRTVSAAAASCADANIATTAAIVRGEGALAWLRETGLPARLVETNGGVHTVGAWPAQDVGMRPLKPLGAVGAGAARAPAVAARQAPATATKAVPGEAGAVRARISQGRRSRRTAARLLAAQATAAHAIAARASAAQAQELLR